MNLNRRSFMKLAAAIIPAAAISTRGNFLFAAQEQILRQMETTPFSRPLSIQFLREHTAEVIFKMPIKYETVDGEHELATEGEHPIMCNSSCTIGKFQIVDEDGQWLFEGDMSDVQGIDGPIHIDPEQEVTISSLNVDLGPIIG